MKVKECMCNNVCCVKPETNIKEVAKLMCDNHIGCIPVCDNNDCVCGIVTDCFVVSHVIRTQIKHQLVILCHVMYVLVKKMMK